MHELGLCEAIVESIEQHAGDRPVAAVRVRVGRLLHVHPDAFDQSFALAAAGSVAEDARAELIVLPAGGHCRSCGANFETGEDWLVACPHCESVDVEVTGGNELILESIEYRG
jgi:hydrogenase nickel incorporation protein HypA/HybF